MVGTGLIIGTPVRRLFQSTIYTVRMDEAMLVKPPEPQSFLKTLFRKSIFAPVCSLNCLSKSNVCWEFHVLKLWQNLETNGNLYQFLFILQRYFLLNWAPLYLSVVILLYIRRRSMSSYRDIFLKSLITILLYRRRDHVCTKITKMLKFGEKLMSSRWSLSYQEPTLSKGRG